MKLAEMETGRYYAVRAPANHEGSYWPDDQSYWGVLPWDGESTWVSGCVRALLTAKSSPYRVIAGIAVYEVVRPRPCHSYLLAAWTMEKRGRRVAWQVPDLIVPEPSCPECGMPVSHEPPRWEQKIITAEFSASLVKAPWEEFCDAAAVRDVVYQAESATRAAYWQEVIDRRGQESDGAR